jgi:dienelactone hydrolase
VDTSTKGNHMSSHVGLEPRVLARALSSPALAGLVAGLACSCGGSAQPHQPSTAADAVHVSTGVSPPAATGTAAVGYERKTLVDHQRRERLVPGGGPRRVAVRIWYPAAAPGPKSARVFTTAEQTAWETAGKLAPGTLDGLGGAATTGAPAAHGHHPVLLLSHGFGETTALLGADAVDLASHGYVIVGIDHPGDASAVDLGGGHVVVTSPALKHGSAASVALRVEDMRFVLGQLGTLRGAGRLDLDHVGAFGHSNGGAAAAGAMLLDRRVDAGVDLDGAMFGPVIARGLDRPFAVARGGGPDAAYRTLTQFRHHLRGPHPFVQWKDTAHHGFTDLVWLAPQVHLDAVAADVGAVDPATAVKQQRAWLLRFFNRYLGR